MEAIFSKCRFCLAPNPNYKIICEWCGMSTKIEKNIKDQETSQPDNITVTFPSTADGIDELLFQKMGDFKSGFFSKKNASTFFFYKNRIVVRPAGINRFFNSADIIIPNYEIVGVEPLFRVIGYNFILKTRSKNFVLSFLGDKEKISQLLHNYLSK
jgi:hypothetical protein